MPLPAVYVIFGATGGIASELAKRLLAAHSKVVLAAQQGDKLNNLKENLGGGDAKEIDVMNSKQVCRLHVVVANLWQAVSARAPDIVRKLSKIRPWVLSRL